MMNRITMALRGDVQKNRELSALHEKPSVSGKLPMLHGERSALHENPSAYEELSALRGELHSAQRDLSAAYRTFDLVTDPDLIESWVYRISAAQARYHYLLRTIRAYDMLPPER